MDLITLIFCVISCVTAMDQDTLDLLTPSRAEGEACGYMACPIVRENHLNIHIVPHTHGELGFTRSFFGHFTGRTEFNITIKMNMKKILDNTITELWEKKHRKFTLFDTAYLFYWWANRDGTVRRMIYELLRQGRLYLVGGSWSMSDEATASYHSIIDQFTYALRKLNSTFLECGRPLVTWQADVFGHSKEFASLMAQMGFDGHFINPISLEDELSRMASKTMEFLWRGSDDIGSDSDIFTHKLFDGYWSPPGFCFGAYCTDPLLITSDSIFKNVDERAKAFIKSMKERQAPNYDTQHLMVMMGHRFGYFDAGVWFANIDTLIDSVNALSARSGGNMTLYYSTPACYLKARHYENPSLSTKQDDFYPFAYDKDTYAAGMYTSRPTVKYMVREGHVYMQMAKQIQVLSNMYNNDGLFEEILWVNGVMQDHTIITGAMTDEVKRYYTKRMYKAIQKSTVVMRMGLNKLRNCPKDVIYYRCVFNQSSCWSTDSSYSYIIIYNVLSWPITMPVRLPIHYAKYTVFDPNGKKMKAAILKVPDSILNLPERSPRPSDHELVFLAEHLPPMGYRSYLLQRDREIYKRSIIKKLNKNKKSKYFTKQTNSLILDDDYNNMGQEYDSFDAHKAIAKVYKNVTKTEDNFSETTTLITTDDKNNDEIEDVTVKYRKMNSEYANDETIKDLDINKTIYPIIDRSKDDDGYFYVDSQDLFIKNKYIRLNLDKSRKINNIELSNGLNISLRVDICFYASDDPKKLDPDTKRVNPGSYFFRPMDPNPESIKGYEVKVYKTGIVEEVQYKLAEYASFVARIYEDKPYIEIDWVIGPIPIDDEVGKEIFVNYATDLKNYGVFYTDSNGRQTVKRIRNVRATYQPTKMDPISGNLYPVTSKIYMEDSTKNIRLSIFNDRSQAGSSLTDGQINLLVHRRILTDETGWSLFLNETINNKGLVVRGTHYIYVSKADYKPNKIFEKKFAKEIELTPKILVSGRNPYDLDNPIREWTRYNNQFSGIRIKLPIGVHILTLEQWDNNAILLRLENYLEKQDCIKDGAKKVFLRDLFVHIDIISMNETTLGANMWLKDHVPLQWGRNEKFVKNFNKYYGVAANNVELSDDEGLKPFEEVDLDAGIVLKPQQIRTFVVNFQYIGI